MLDICRQFQLPSPAVSCMPYGSGHINQTYRVTAQDGSRYILQRLSREAFQDIPGLMENVATVTSFLAARETDARRCLHLRPTVAGRSYLTAADGACYRMYDFIEGGVCLDQAEQPQELYACAYAFGRFQRLLADFPAATLHETIPHFHDTLRRYAAFDFGDLVRSGANTGAEDETNLQKVGLSGRMRRYADGSGAHVPDAGRKTDDTGMRRTLFDRLFVGGYLFPCASSAAQFGALSLSASAGAQHGGAVGRDGALRLPAESPNGLTSHTTISIPSPLCHDSAKQISTASNPRSAETIPSTVDETAMANIKNKFSRDTTRQELCPNIIIDAELVHVHVVACWLLCCRTALSFRCGQIAENQLRQLARSSQARSFPRHRKMATARP